jgi:hypothetical protein
MFSQNSPNHLFTIVRKTTKHVFACETDEQLESWVSKVESATLAAEAVPVHSVAVAASVDSLAYIDGLAKEVAALKMKNTQLKLKKASTKAQAARNSPEMDKGHVIDLMLSEFSLLQKRNEQLKTATAGFVDTTKAEQAVEVEDLVTKVLAAKKRNAELKAGKTPAEIQTCLDRAFARKEAKIRELVSTLEALRQTNHDLKNPTPAEEKDKDSGQVPPPPPPPPSFAASPRGTPRGKRAMRRYSMSKTVSPADVTHIAEPAQTGYLKKRSAAVLKRWDRRYFEVGENAMVCYTVTACMCILKLSSLCIYVFW